MTERNLALAQAALEDGAWQRAADHARAAVEAGYPSAREIVATTAWKQRDYTGAIAALEATDGLSPMGMALLARLYLLTGDQARGWTLVRDGCRSGAFGPSLYDLPRLENPDVAGKHVAVWSMGCGDDMFFARFVPQLVARGARVTVNCRRALLRLFQTLDGVEAVLPLGQRAENADVHVQIAELPQFLGPDARTAWPGEPYLRAAEPIRHAGPGFDIGLVWAADSRHMEAQERSSQLAQMHPLAEVPGVRLHSLQMGAPRGQLNPPPRGLEGVVDRMHGVADFADTANLIAGLDLVISIDTSVSNLAGSMGARLWTAVPYVPDWRWGQQGPGTPWYPSATVFRQDVPGDWLGVFTAMAEALVDEAPTHQNPAHPLPRASLAREAEPAAPSVPPGGGSRMPSAHR